MLLVGIRFIRSTRCRRCSAKFTAPAALNGKVVYSFTLADSLAKGPVVLYFFPAAFSVGCSIEAHEFAEAITAIRGARRDRDRRVRGRYRHARQVLGPGLPGKFPVASDNTQNVMKSYDAVMQTRPEYANRVSYVIAPDGAKVITIT